MEADVWVGERVLSARMPALILVYPRTVFEPLWRVDGAVVSGVGGTRVVRVPLSVAEPRAVVRVGRGVGRGAGERYYLVVPGEGLVERLRRIPAKRVRGSWYTCVERRGQPRYERARMCFEWVEGRLALTTGWVIRL